jgi:sugar phosphate isomerase/epimerase
MYSVRGEMARDPLAATRAVTAMGYRYLEYANLTAGDPGVGFPVDPGALRAAVAEAGAEVVSVHVWPVDESTIADILAYHRELGTRFVVSKFLCATLEEMVALAETSVRIGERIREAGMRHLLHTGLLRHDGARTDLDEVLDRVPPELLEVELDTYWSRRSGLDPAALIARYGERIAILHQKDLPAAMRRPVDVVGALPPNAPLDIEHVYGNPEYVGPEDFTEVGSGLLDLQGTIDAANAHSRSEYLFVEQDFTRRGELESVRLSLDALRRRTGVEV